MTAVPGPLTSPPVALAVAAAVVTTVVALVALWHRSAPGAGWLAVVMVVDAVVVAFAVWGREVPRTRQVALAVGGLGLLAAVPYVAFVVAYTGRGRHLTYWTLLGYGGPLLVAAALYATTQYHGLALERPIGVHHTGGLTLLTYGGYGPLVAPTLLYLSLLVFGALLLVLQTVVRHDRLYLGQSAALFVGALAPLAAALPSLGGFSRAGGATGPRSVMVASILMSAAGFALAYAAARHRLFEFVPAVRQLGDRAAVDDLDEGVLIVDDGDTVVKPNAAATAVLDCESRDVVGTSAGALFETVGVEDLSSTPTTFEAAGGTYEVTTSPITDERDRPIGRTFVIRDVTRRERRKQRLQVLNRVLRHNVRNDMTVVRTHASVVAEEGDDRLAELGETVVETADKLVAMGEKVRRTEQLLAAEELAEQAIDVADLLDGVVDEEIVATDHTAVDATVEVADDAAVAQANRPLLEMALENVVENAVVHNDDAVPTLAVTADRLGGDVRLTVADDGPGIPAQELTALSAGRETDLQHASSLGLWLVLWSVERLGGDLHIEHLDPTGTAVSIWLPDAAVDDHAAVADQPAEGDQASVADQAAQDDPVEGEADQTADAAGGPAVSADGLELDGEPSGEAGGEPSGEAGGEPSGEAGGEPSGKPAAGATTDAESGGDPSTSVDAAAVDVVADGVATDDVSAEGIATSDVAAGEPVDAGVPTGNRTDDEGADQESADGDGGESAVPMGTPRSRDEALPPPAPASASSSRSDGSDDDEADPGTSGGEAAGDGEAAEDDEADDAVDATDDDEGATDGVVEASEDERPRERAGADEGSDT